MRALPVALAMLAAVVVGCSTSEDQAPPRETTSTRRLTSSPDQVEATTTAAPTLANGDCTKRPEGSSPSEFDAGGGTYAALDVSLDPRIPALTFNVVQWLSGDDARDAWRRDNSDDPDGPPNDYYIVDQAPRLRTVEVDRGARVFLTHLRTDGSATVEADTLPGLKTYLDQGSSGDTYWVTINSGVITEICQQYRP